MKTILVNVPELMQKVLELTKDKRLFVKISILNESMDQSIYYPSCLHFEAFTDDGYPVDYESIDQADYCYIEDQSAG
jgi:hypothetical protein